MKNVINHKHEAFRTVLNLIVFVLLPLVLGAINMYKIKVFIDVLGEDSSGVYQVYMQLFTIFTLVENGIELSIAPFLYQYLVQKNYDKVNSILKGGLDYWKKIGIANVIISLLLIPLAPFIVKNSTIDIIPLIIIQSLFAAKSLFGYLYAGPHALTMADNRGYLVGGIDNIMNILGSIGAIITAMITQNLMTAVLIEVILVFAVFTFKFIYLKSKYPWYERNYRGEKSFVFVKNIKGTLANKISEMLINSTDILVVSILIGTVAANSFGIYMSFAAILLLVFGTALVNSFQSVLGKKFVDLASDVKGKITLVQQLKLFNYAVMFATIPTVMLGLNQFIGLFYPTDVLLSNGFYLAFFVSFYFKLIRTPYNTLKISLGNYDRFTKISMYDAILKIVLSFVLGYYFGVIGVILSAPIAYIFTDMWMDVKVFEYELQQRNIFPFLLEICFHFVLTLGLGSVFVMKLSPLLQSYVTLILGCAIIFVILASLSLIIWCLTRKNKGEAGITFS